MRIDRLLILILNHDGRRLLEACLPSILAAAARSAIPSRVAVIDNASRDDSLGYLEAFWPEVQIYREPNRGLVSFNEVLSEVSEPVVLLLNNDVKLAADSIPPLVEALRTNEDALFAAPQCWTFDGRLYEGMRTRVRSRFGFVQGLCRVPEHEDRLLDPDQTAAAGPVLLVNRARFLEMGGFDPLYFPGRLEDLDLGFRGWMSGYRGYYVPDSLTYHLGMGSFGPAFGSAGCDRLAVRNTFLFCWKNLDGRRLVRHVAWIVPRLTHALLRGRVGFVAAWFGALRRIGEISIRRRERSPQGIEWLIRQESFFERFGF